MGRRYQRMFVMALAVVLLLVASAASAAAYSYQDLSVYGIRTPDGEKYGYISCTTGEWVIPPRFDAAWRFWTNGLAKVKINGKYALIDLNGRILGDQFDDMSYSFREGLLMVSVNGKYGFINESGRLVFDTPYLGFDTRYLVFSEGLIQI